MNTNEKNYELDVTLEEQLLSVDEEKLPILLSERMGALQKSNLAYESAKEREAATRQKVANALNRADDLVKRAKGTAQNSAKTHSFLKWEWTSKKDEISALQANLKEMIECGIDSAEAQKELVEVQAALADSQTALLKVQETQMAYQGYIANVMKFLYGLSALNLASSQSVLIKLQAILSGASKEKLGEMAQQQLMLAMDQLKNQESIILRIRENKELISQLDANIENQGRAINNLYERENEQDSLIEDLQKQDEEQDSLIEDLQKQDEEQDSLIEDLQKQDEEQDSLIEDLQKQDEEQDSLIEDLQKQDEEQDSLIEDLQKQDEEQDKLIAQTVETTEEHERLIQEAMEADEEQDKLIAQNTERTKENARLIQEAMEADEEQGKLLELHQEKATEHERHIKELQNEVADLKTEIEQLKADLICKGNKLQTHIVTGVAVVALIIALLGMFF